MVNRYATFATTAGLMALALTLAAAPLSAQSADEEAVGEVIERLFDGMRARDTAAIRSTFHEDARLGRALSDADGPGVRFGEIDSFIASIGSATDFLDERLSDVEIRVDDNLATAWTPYEFYRGEEFSHCGVNAFQLVLTTDGWKILHITDTSRQDRCGVQ